MTEGQEMAQRTRQATNSLSREEREELLKSGLEHIKLGNKSVNLKTSCPLCDRMQRYKDACRLSNPVIKDSLTVQTTPIIEQKHPSMTSEA